MADSPETVSQFTSLEEILAEYLRAEDAGEKPDPKEYLDRYPEHREELEKAFRDQSGVDAIIRPLLAAGPVEAPLIDNYDILEPVGPPGGMGMVYKARDKNANRLVALKVIRADRLDSLAGAKRHKMIERFIAEAQTAAQLEHENIVKVYHVGEWKDQPFYAMRYIEGTSLAGLIKDGPMEPRRAAAYMEQVALGLHEGHQHGVLHRDMKPQNVMVEAATDRPMVVDYGLAKLTQSGQDQTATGDLMGTPPYMSPEQAQSASMVTVASDVYSLGATLYALLTGRPPFQGETPIQTLRQVVDEQPTPPSKVRPGIPRDLETICLKCLQKQPGKRYTSAAALAEDLRRFISGEPICGRRVGGLERLLLWCRRNPAITSLTTLVAVALVASAVVAFAWALWAESQRNKLATEKGLADKARSHADKERQKVERLLHASQFKEAYDYYLARDFVNCKRALDGCSPERWRLEHNFLINQLERKSRVFPEHTLLTGDKNWLVVRSRDGVVKVWESNTGKERHAIPGIKDGSLVMLSPDGRLLFAAVDKTIKVWDLQVRTEFTLEGHATSIHSLALSPDGTLLFSGDGERGKPGKIKVWDVSRHKNKYTLEGHTGHVQSLVVSPDGKRLFSGSGGPDGFLSAPRQSCEIKVWDVDAGREAATFHGHMQSVTSLVLSPDGKRLISSSNDSTIKVWDLDTGKVARTLRTLMRGPPIALTVDGKRLYSASIGFDNQPVEPGWITMWDLDTGKETLLMRGHEGAIRRLIPSVDGKRLWSEGDKGGFKLWELEVREEALTRECVGEVVKLVLSPDGKRVFWTSWAFPEPGDIFSIKSSNLNVWDLDTGKVSTIDQTDTTAVALSFDGKRLYSAHGKFGEPGQIKVWDAEKGEVVRILSGHPTSVRCLTTTADGTRLLSAGNDHTIRIWDPETCTVTLTLKGSEPCVALSGDGKWLFSASGKTIHAWNLETGKVAYTLDAHTANVSSLALSPDEKWLISGDGGPFEVDAGEIKIWDLATSKERMTLRGHSAGVTSLAVSNDGKQLFSASFDRTIRLWDLETEKTLLILRHSGFVYCLALSADESRLFAGTGWIGMRNGEIKVWDLRTAKR